MFKKQKILCFVLVFDQYEIIKKSLEFLTSYSNQLDLIIIENPSPKSGKIGSLIDRLGKQGLIKEHWLYEKNVTSFAFDNTLLQNLGRISKTPYVMVTDGDLTCRDKGWLKEELSIMRNPEVFACGISLSRSNLPLKAFPEAESWIPDDISEHNKFYEAVTGGHLLLFRGKEFASFMVYKEKHGKKFVDGEMHKYCYDIIGKKWARTKKSEALHLTWDLYQDPDHPYTKLKTSRSFEKTWYHNEKSGYKIITF